MHPILISVGPITLYAYGLLLAVAFLVATWRAGAIAEAWPDPPVPVAADQIMSLCTVVMIGGLIGARAFYVVSNAKVFALYPLEILAIWHGGLVWYGGFLGGLTAGAWYLQRHRLSPLRAMDQMAPFVALGHAIGRIGCFFNGCCYGVPTTAWFGVEFPGHAHAVIPTQLIESGALLALYAGLRRLQRPACLRRPGTVWAGYVMAYATFRFFIEFWRGDQQLFVDEWTLQQVVSVALALTALGALLVIWRRDVAHLSFGRRAR